VVLLLGRCTDFKFTAHIVALWQDDQSWVTLEDLHQVRITWWTLGGLKKRNQVVDRQLAGRLRSKMSANVKCSVGQ